MIIKLKLQNEPFETPRIFTGCVDSIEDAQEKVTAFITSFGLGSSKFIGALLFDESDTYVGYVSYNGRFWNAEHTYAKEVLLVD